MYAPIERADQLHGVHVMYVCVCENIATSAWCVCVCVYASVLCAFGFCVWLCVFICYLRGCICGFGCDACEETIHTCDLQDYLCVCMFNCVHGYVYV